MTTSYELRLSSQQWSRLERHLFPGDGDEHGAVVLAGVSESPAGTRLIARHVILAEDGVNYVPGERGYRMLTADFVRDVSDQAATEHLAYIAIHCHGGTGTVRLSEDDRLSQARTYPAILDILDGPPVAGAVFARGAAAGQVWLHDRSQHMLDRVVVSGKTRMVLTPSPRTTTRRGGIAEYDRQSLLFGEEGQRILSESTVAVIGCGGIGSLLVEYLARLGIGRLVVIDPERVELTNLPRLIGATRWDARSFLTREGRPCWLQRLGRRTATRKTRVAARTARRANPRCDVVRIDSDVTRSEVTDQLREVDYLLLAADTYRARLVVNGLAFQYGIPGMQLGAKVRSRDDGSILDAYSVVRPFGPTDGCLVCNGLIPAARLSEETKSDSERRAQRYVDDPAVQAPSVITLNAIAASWAANEVMFALTGLPRRHNGADFVTFYPISGNVERTTPRQDPACRECGDGVTSRRGRADAKRSPTS